MVTDSECLISAGPGPNTEGRDYPLLVITARSDQYQLPPLDDPAGVPLFLHRGWELWP